MTFWNDNRPCQFQPDEDTRLRLHPRNENTNAFSVDENLRDNDISIISHINPENLSSSHVPSFINNLPNFNPFFSSLQVFQISDDSFPSHLLSPPTVCSLSDTHSFFFFFLILLTFLCPQKKKKRRKRRQSGRESTLSSNLLQEMNEEINAIVRNSTVNSDLQLDTSHEQNYNDDDDDDNENENENENENGNEDEKKDEESNNNNTDNGNHTNITNNITDNSSPNDNTNPNENANESGHGHQIANENGDENGKENDSEIKVKTKADETGTGEFDELIGGYDEQLFITEKCHLIDHFICAMLHITLYFNKILISSLFFFFGKNVCLRRYYSEYIETCPLCQETVNPNKCSTYLKPNHTAKGLMNDLLFVKCPNACKGCSWTDKLGSLQSHIQFQCDFQFQLCTFCQNRSILRKDFASHLALCPDVVIPCSQICGMYTYIYIFFFFFCSYLLCMCVFFYYYICLANYV
ncbi:RNA-binding region RNP-1 domain-containing protein [Reticulomyxa filosa]|uniref:RNA-binding region RNP-1 domain-containing protein n=1 Tax=Reticulomyxa filosa TaxID=46433 RepID=X6LVK1_RETFI|nr:RNA-binding region RNP-1 domain-containing protein [Reticulomyxa filosa]|eukprot:ETO05659.1 RNA-binding region RNP-1 domain-containing protein [Reticulomyxa filosa]